MGKWWMLASAGLVVLALVAPAWAQEAQVPPPPGDCWSGVLSDEPVQCYALEEAQRAGLIEVDGMYVLDGPTGDFLKIYLSFVADDVRHVIDFFMEKGREFLERWPERAPPRPTWSLICADSLECLLRETLDFSLTGMTVWTETYEGIRFGIGAAADRFSEGGWASHRQVWPAAARAETGAGGARQGSSSPDKFDVSDVDMTNLPTMDCSNISITPRGSGTFSLKYIDPPSDIHWPDSRDFHWPGAVVCHKDADLALSVAGATGEVGASYFQIKDPPEDEAALHEIRETLVPCYDRVGPCTHTATTTATVLVDGEEVRVSTSTTERFVRDTTIEVEIISVEHSFLELWRWATILDRFTRSRGNTIGITHARVGENRGGYSSAVWPLAGCGRMIL